MSDDRVAAPALCSSKCTTRSGWKGAMLFESPKRAQRGRWIAAQETIVVDGESE